MVLGAVQPELSEEELQSEYKRILCRLQVRYCKLFMFTTDKIIFLADKRTNCTLAR